MSPAKSSRSSHSKDDTSNPDYHLPGVGNYIFQKTVGEGNFAKVKLAKHKLTGAEVAVKVIDKTTLDDKKLGKLYREVRIMKMLHHPHIVKLYEVIETKHTVFLVMEYASGGELYDYLVVHGKMKEKEARLKFRQILSAVSYCHKKRVIHRDLKAENLLLDANLDIKIADFGFSNYYDPDAKLDTFCGSPPYAAPELFQGRRYTGPEVDIWSLGVILYVLTTGCLPFDGKNLQEMRESVCRGKYRIPFYLSDSCEKLLRKFLIRDPSKRSSLDMLVDDAWINEGHNDSPISVDLSGKAVEEDESLIRLMETKYHVERSAILQSLRDTVYDDVAAIYYLLYFDREARSRAVTTDKPSLTVSTALGPPSASVHVESQSAAAVLPPQVSRQQQQQQHASSSDAHAAGGVAMGKIEEDGDHHGGGGGGDAVVQLRAQPAKAKPKKRRFTVGGEADVQKLADEDEEAAELLKRIQMSNAVEDVTADRSGGGRLHANTTNIVTAASTTSPVIVTPSLQGSPPAGWKAPAENDDEDADSVPAQLPNSGGTRTTNNAASPSSSTNANNNNNSGSPSSSSSSQQQQQQSEEQQQPRKRHNTIVGILRSHMRRQSDVSGIVPIATLQEQNATKVMDPMGGGPGMSSQDASNASGMIPNSNNVNGSGAVTSSTASNANTAASGAGGGGEESNKPRSLRFTFNSNTTSTKPPDEIIAQVISACDVHSVHHRLSSRFLVECIWVPGAVNVNAATAIANAAASGTPSSPGLPGSASGSNAAVTGGVGGGGGGLGSPGGVKFEIEVCKLPRLKNLHGLRFKRVGGSSSEYKEACEMILKELSL